MTETDIINNKKSDDVEEPKPVKKKRGRKPNPNKKKPENKEPKKRGRKPKGGKIITKPISELTNTIVNQNVILHLKCTMDDIIIKKPFSYTPDIEDIQSYSINDNKSDIV